MILGMNPRTLRAKREWQVYLWPKKRHWALVLQPVGQPFSARVVDDFLHMPDQIGTFEVASEKLYLVFELLLEGGDSGVWAAEGDSYLMLGVKSDFTPARHKVWSLGLVGPMYFEDIVQRAIGVVCRYRGYSLVGCNCQHFASEFAASLGVARSLVPEDEALALQASQTAVAVGASGAIVMVSAAAGAGAAPSVLVGVAAGAGAIGLAGGLALVGVASGYRALHDVFREERCECAANGQCLCSGTQHGIHCNASTLQERDGRCAGSSDVYDVVLAPDK